MTADKPIIPGHLRKTIESVLGELEKRGSDELKNDVHQLRQFLEKTNGISIHDLSEKVSQTKKKRTKLPRHQLMPLDLTPASREALKSQELKEVDPGIRQPKDVR
jgi:hypothetical protein